MSSLLEDLGGSFNWLFVPSNVIEAQEDTQIMLQKKGEMLNGSPNILATVKTDKTAATTLQNMNRSVYLSGDRDRESGRAVLDALFQSIEDIPTNLKNAAKGTGEAIGSGLIGGAIPTWLRWLIGIALVGAILYFVTKLVRTASAS